MKIKKIIMMMSMAMLIMLPAGCGKEEKEDIHLIIKTPPLVITNGSESEITEAYQLLEKAASDFSAQYDSANVSIDVVKFDYVDEKKYITDCFDTENAADILFEGYFNMSSYVYSGRVASLDDIISTDMRDDFSADDLELSKVADKTYMLPYYSLQNTLCYNKELFRQCGLDEYIAPERVVTNWTMDEWNVILDTLAEKLPDMSYPMMMYGKSDQGDTHIMTLLRCKGCPFFDEDGYVCMNTEEGIEALEWINEGYRKGYFPAGSENLELSDCMSLFDNDQLAISLTNNAFFPVMDHDKFGLVNFPSNGETGFSTAFVTGFMVFDNGDEERLKVAKEFLSYFYRQEELLDYEAQGIPSNYSVVNRMKDDIYMLDEYRENGRTAINFTNNSPNWQGNDDSVRSVFWPHIHALLSGDETVEECAEGIDEECNAAIKKGRDEGAIHT